jgi:hypothetical protein
MSVTEMVTSNHVGSPDGNPTTLRKWLPYSSPFEADLAFIHRISASP